MSDRQTGELSKVRRQKIREECSRILSENGLMPLSAMDEKSFSAAIEGLSYGKLTFNIIHEDQVVFFKQQVAGTARIWSSMLSNCGLQMEMNILHSVYDDAEKMKRFQEIGEYAGIRSAVETMLSDGIPISDVIA